MKPSETAHCRTCGDPYIRRGMVVEDMTGSLGRLPGTPGARFRFCPSCWAAAKIGYRAGFALAAIAGAVFAFLARWFQL